MRIQTEMSCQSLKRKLHSSINFLRMLLFNPYSAIQDNLYIYYYCYYEYPRMFKNTVKSLIDKITVYLTNFVRV